jgi:glycosyltransferase involved in cell wall biosynthesis
MKAAIYNPYWDTLGGGERYTYSFAKVLEDFGYEVDIEWKDKNLLKRLESRFGIKFGKINITDDVNKGDGYDLCFWVSDGSIPLLHARTNLLHFQVPFIDVNGRSLLNKMKFYRIKKIICNSEFTKNIIDKEYGVQSKVIYPPCDVEIIKPKRKENIILSVGRFSQLLQSKHQDILIDVFGKMIRKGLKDWKLILAGGSEVGSGEYLKNLKKRTHEFPIEFIENSDYKVLINLYGISKIFWSGSGYGENEVKNPEKVEHFGITLVEAMAGGCVPVAYDAGGHKEIIENTHNGFLWKDSKELAKITKQLISDNKYLRGISKEAIRRSNYFSYASFKESVEKILH